MADVNDSDVELVSCAPPWANAGDDTGRFYYHVSPEMRKSIESSILYAFRESMEKDTSEDGEKDVEAFIQAKTNDRRWYEACFMVNGAMDSCSYMVKDGRSEVLRLIPEMIDKGCHDVRRVEMLRTAEHLEAAHPGILAFTQSELTSFLPSMRETITSKVIQTPVTMKDIEGQQVTGVQPSASMGAEITHTGKTEYAASDRPKSK